MSETVKSIETQSAARKCVYECLGAENPRLAVEELVGDVEAVTDPNVLKVAEYALLRAPLIDGMKDYLAHPLRYRKGLEASNPAELYRDVGEVTAVFTQGTLLNDPNYDFAERINSRRVEVLGERGENAEGIDGVLGTIGLAARSAAITTYATALVNAFEIAESTDLLKTNRKNFINAVKSSGALIRSLSRLHLKQLTIANKAISQHAVSIQEGQKTISINADGLKTDDKGSVRLAKPLRDWQHPVGGRINEEGKIVSVVLDSIGNKEIRDVQIGCLLSFDPGLTTAYYQHYVDLMEQCGVWPKELRSAAAEN